MSHLLKMLALVVAFLAIQGFPREAWACSTLIPKMPACNTPKCIDGIWQPWPVAAGTACNNGAGLCDGGIIIPGQVDPQAIGYCIGPADAYPHFSVQSLIYMPPGKQSSVSYGIGSSEGSRVSTQTTTSNGAQVQISIVGIGGSANYQEGVVSGNAMAVTKADQYTRSEFVNSALDSPVRGSDVFDLWVNNVKYHDYYSTSNGWELLQWTTSDGNAPVIFSYSADELLGNKQPLDEPPGRLSAFNSLSPADKQAILSMDVPLKGGALDARRYQFVSKQNGTTSMSGPDYVGYPITGYTYSLNYNQTYDAINGSFVNQSGTLLAGFDLGVVKAGASVTWVQNLSETRTSTTGTQKTASLTLKTPTVGCYMVVDVYIDAAFGTYLALPSSSTGCN